MNINLYIHIKIGRMDPGQKCERTQGESQSGRTKFRANEPGFVISLVCTLKISHNHTVRTFDMQNTALLSKTQGKSCFNWIERYIL